MDVEIVRLLWLVENFFTYSDKHYHEIAVYFLMRLPLNWKYLLEAGPFEGEDGGVRLIFLWFPTRQNLLSGLPLLPGFLQTALQELPESVRHIIHRDSSAQLIERSKLAHEICARNAAKVATFEKRIAGHFPCRK